MARPKHLYWIGARTAEGRPAEWFGGFPGPDGYDPIPARDLSPDETAALTEAQWQCIESETGKRLYANRPAGENSAPASQPETNPASGTTTAQPAET